MTTSVDVTAVKPAVDYLSLARDAFTTSTSYFDSSIRIGLEADIRRFQSRHPVGSKYNSDAWKARSKLFRPKTRAMIQKGEAMAAEAFFSNEDITSVVPEDEGDPVQMIAAEISEALLDHHLSFNMPWLLTVCGAFQDASVTGMVCSYNGWDKKNDVARVTLLPLENLRFDPGADWFDPVNTSPYWIQMIPMYVKDVLARMRGGKWKQLDESKIRSECSKVWDTVRMTREHGRQDSKDQAPAYTPYSIVWVHKNIVEIDGEDMLYYTLGTTDLLSEPTPLKNEYPSGKRPYTAGFVLVETHKTYPSGKSRVGAEVQDEINEIANQRVDNVKFVLNKRYFAKRNAQVDLRSLMRNVPGSATLMNDPDKDVRVVETPDVTGSSFSEHDRLNMDFDDVAGSFSSSSVASNRNLNETVGGMSLFSSGANLVTGYSVRVFAETWLVPTLEQIKDNISHYETSEKRLQIAGKKSQTLQKVIADMAEKEGVDTSAISVDIDKILQMPTRVKLNMSMSAISPMTKMQQLAYAMDMIVKVLKDGTLQSAGMDVQELIKEVMGIAGYKDGDRFFNGEEDEDPRIAQLQQQCEQLQQAVDAKNPPEVVKAQVDKITAEIKLINSQSVKVGVEAAYAAMQAAGVIAMTPATAPIADAVMQSSGYQTPNPQGVDPNYPIASAALEAPANAAIPPVQPNTSPALPPVPQQAPSAVAGSEAGIETQRLGS